jgi:hypothetical protein
MVFMGEFPSRPGKNDGHSAPAIAVFGKRGCPEDP